MEKMTISEYRKRYFPDKSIDFIIEALMNGTPSKVELPWKVSEPIEIAGLLQRFKQNGVDFGVARFFQYLRDTGYLIKSGRDKNIPTRLSLEMGLFIVEKKYMITDDGSNVMLRITKVTGKGQVYFANKFLTGKE